MISMSWEERELFNNPQTSRNITSIIEKYLITDDRRALLAEHRLSLDDILEGRNSIAINRQICAMFANWNQQLGYKHFLEDDDSTAMIESIEKNIGLPIEFR